MYRICLGICFLLLVHSLAVAEDKGENNAGTPAEQYKAIVKEFGEAANASWNATTDEERQTLATRIEKLPQRLLEVVEKHPKDPIALDALTQIVTVEYWLDNYSTHAGWGQDSPQAKAIAILQRDHLQSERLAETCKRVHFGFRPECETFLRAVMEKSPHREIRGLACLQLAQFLKIRWQRLDLLQEQPEMARRYEGLYGKKFLDELRRQDRAEVVAQAEALFEQAIKQYGDVKVPYSGTVRETAESELHEIRFLSVGKVAQEIEGKDQDGKTFKLSDYRGKVVLLYFWQQF